MNEPTKALQTIDGQVLAERPVQMIRPLADPNDAYAALEEFQALKARIVTEDDKITNAGKTYVKKSGWRKLAAAFGISTECVAEEREDLHPGGFLWRVRVRATAPNGRYAEGTAGCASNERKFSHVEHDVYAQAYTRACNRAISDLVGGGEVSAEEMKAEPPPPTISRPQAEAVTEKFFKAIVEQGDFPRTPLPTEVVAACVMAGGDLRRAYKILQAQHGEPVEDGTPTEPSEEAEAPTDG